MQIIETATNAKLPLASFFLIYISQESNHVHSFHHLNRSILSLSSLK
jgi:hypothetical protein